jgi:hypothetical protein
MTKLIAAASFLLFLAPVANGQNLSAYVVGSVNGIGLCSQGGLSKASCVGTYQSQDGNSAASVSMLAEDDYGFVEAGAGAAVNCSASCVIGASAQAQANFADAAMLQGVPSSGAYFFIKVRMNGLVTDRTFVYDSTFLELQISDNVNGTNCSIANNPNGTCSTWIPVNHDETVYFSVVNQSSAFPSLQVINGNGTMEVGAGSKGTVTKLAVVNQQGQVLNNVIILTASGHIYPQ